MKINGCEDIWVEIKTKVKNLKNERSAAFKKLVVGAIYRHPGPHYVKFIEALEKNFVLLSRKNTKVIILGDINIDLMKFNVASKVTEYVHSVLSHGYNLFIDKPTRVTAQSATCIDHVYSNFSIEEIESVILESNVSDHYSTLTNIYGIYSKNEQKDIYYRNTNLSSEKWAQFNSELEYNLACSLPSDESKFDVNEYANCLIDIYKSLIDKFMPSKKKTRKQKNFGTSPWMTDGLLTSIDKKDELHKLSKKDPSVVQKFKAHSNLLVKLKNKARIEYDKQKLAEYGHDKSKTWRYVNELMKRKRKTKNSIKNIRNAEGEMISDEKEVVNCLVNYFGSVAKSMNDKISETDSLEPIKDPLDYLPNRVESNFEFSDTTTSEILDVILSQDSKKPADMMRSIIRLLKERRIQ